MSKNLSANFSVVSNYLLEKVSNDMIAPFFRHEFNLTTDQARIFANKLQRPKYDKHIFKRNPKIAFSNLLPQNIIDNFWFKLQDQSYIDELNFKLLNQHDVDFYIYKTTSNCNRRGDIHEIKFYMKFDTESERYKHAEKCRTINNR